MDKVHAERNNFIQFFIYLRAELNGQWPITESARIQTASAIKQQRTKQTNKKQRKMDQLRIFKLRHDLLKISVDLQTAFAAETHLAEGATERGEVTYVPSGNTNADCFQGRGKIIIIMIIKNLKLRGFGPLANYANRATAASWRSSTNFCG
jgi:hypothetical protein